ncbi:MAG: transcription antitermination factor NusB [Rubrobacteraceae bacterium]|uniref:transcription antitermination factor NusB n=1 Tax=Rubrobacter naiadicus TaxID=1392641 RepID=UPI002360857B|nr:transcription antitermination factor NusB [Rubrobacter naiadicus]MBX6765237.1 transcription antitermination factor NusB [Rubrobacteraceae bacterium]MCL6438132.1 transcription antitermination factor NusB [Rubrobacteraceae bacterium]
MSRRRARKQAFMVLYQSDVTGEPVEKLMARWTLFKGELDPYARRLIHGVDERRALLDERLEAASEGWPVWRMNAVDRTILRLSLYEILHVEDVPFEVAVAEAKELAKGFSGEEAPAFVGGVLRGAGRLVEHG